MTLRRRCAVAVTALALAAPTAAQAQSSLQPAPPPTGSQPDTTSGSTSGQTPRSSSSTLPATGAEPGILALAGMGLLLCGAGLRLRVRGQGA